MPRILIFLAFAVSSGCGYSDLPSLSNRDADADTDAVLGLDARSSAVQVTASPSSFYLHAYDTRDTLVTVTNSTAATVGIPSLAVVNLTLGTLTFSSSTCTASLPPRGSCTAVGNFVASTAGSAAFRIDATIDSNVSSTSLTATITMSCAATCGAAGTTNCCASSIVPGNAVGASLAGALYYRGYDASGDAQYKDTTSPATVSDFRLDTFPVTVGRFRAFVAEGKGVAVNPPAAGDGAHLKIPGSGWDSAWNTTLYGSTSTLLNALKCDATFQTWTDIAGANEGKPISCLTWAEAFAFCAWDGGYLPTEAEWDYAAAGGSEQRAYPWSNPPGSTAIDCTYANYAPGGTFCVSSGMNRIGSESPKGDSKWGQVDLDGNIYEWLLDWSGNSFPTPCNDCANLTAATKRVVQGGDYGSGPTDLRLAVRGLFPPGQTSANFGVRCARLP
jgi:sulfatase modifying factor 1